MATGETLSTHTLTGYTGGFVFSPDGKILAGWGREEIRLWDTNTGERLTTLTGHTRAVTSVVFSPDGTTLASASYDRTLRLWDTNTGYTRQTLLGHTGSVHRVVFSPDGSTLASGSEDETLRLWDAITGETLSTLTGHTDVVTSVAFSPDGSTLASGSWDDASGIGDKTIRLWDVATGETLSTLTGYTGGFVFSPDGKILAGWGREEIRLWDIATSETLSTLTGHTHWVESVAFSPDGQTFASGSQDKTIQLWDTTTGERLTTLTGHTRAVTSVVFSPDGTTLASGSWDGTVLLWPLAPPAATPKPVAKDINGDGVVNIQDLTLVAAQFGETGEDTPADVNGDGTVDIADLVLVAAAFGEAAAAAPMFAQAESLELGKGIETGRSLLRPEDVRQWIRDAKAANVDPAGIAALERLLAALTRVAAPLPKETVLLANYPNPFNPETWVPYQLSEAAEVTVTIHSSDGKLVRTLELGQVPAGIYQSRSRAAYWDGRNAQGEPVASGVYFYTLSAGDFSATRKMVIRK